MKKVCSNCPRLKHHKNAIYCFGCGKMLKVQSSCFPLKKIGIGVGIFLTFCLAIIILDTAIEGKEIRERQMAIKVQTLPSQWQSVYFLISAIHDGPKRMETFNNIVTDDLPKLTPDNIYLLMSIFHYNYNKAKVASKLMEFRK